MTAAARRRAGRDADDRHDDRQNGWLRIYDQQKDLIAAAQTPRLRRLDHHGVAAGRDRRRPRRWSASPADHVIGIRSMTDATGKLTYKFEGCGTVPDDQPTLIPYIQGKRCLVNKVVVRRHHRDRDAAPPRRPAPGVRGRRLRHRRRVPARRDATSSCINRNKSGPDVPRVLQRARQLARQPDVHRAEGGEGDRRTRARTAFTTETGASEPSRDEGGNAIPAQLDAVHP